MNISFIGFGNMAKAIAKGLLQNKSYTIKAAAPSLSVGFNSQGIETHFDNLAVLPDANILILAIKPTEMGSVLMQIRPYISKNCVVISLAAGRKLNWILHYLDKETPIIRAMPNIAAEVGESATPLIANEFVTDEQKTITESLFSLVGAITWIKEETEIDAYTALSGSGPAYVFLFMEALVDGACSMGLSKEIASSFALQTVQGAVTLAQTTTTSFTDLRTKVTSPAGTTSAAITVLQNLKFKETIQAAMHAAYERSQQLSK